MFQKEWKILNSHIIHAWRGNILREDSVQLPSGGKTEYTYLYHPGSVVIVPLSGNGRVIMVCQFRYTIGTESLEFPTGIIEKDEEAVSAAKRELREETGLIARSLTPLGSFFPSNGISNELMHVFLARDVKQKDVSSSSVEQLEVFQISLDEVECKITHGEITDGPTITAFYLTKRYMGGNY